MPRHERARPRAASLSGAAFQRADVSSSDDCRALVARCAEWGSVDILVNNAGLQHVAPVEEFPDDRWERMLHLMLVGAFYLTKYAIPHMYRRGWGRIVNVASVHALVASPYKSAYVAAKHGLLGLTRTVALEASEVAAYVAFLCSDEASGITGSAQLMDLGWTAR